MTRTLLIIFGLALGIVSLDIHAETPSVEVRTATATQQPISSSHTVYGRVQPDPDAVITVSLPHAGLITRVAARLGQRVATGDVLLEISTAPAAYMGYLQARSTVDYAQRELERQERMLKTQLTTRSQVDAARKALADARSSLQAIEARGANKAGQTLTAPTDGIITALNVSQGDRVQADTSAVAIANGGRLIAVLGVEPEDLAGLHTGTPVSIHSVFATDYQVDSQLSDIHAMIDPQTGLVDVLAPIPQDHVNHLVIGSYLSADLVLDQHTGIVLPRSAVRRDDHGSYVFRVSDNKASRVAVETGIEHEDRIEIRRGLKAGESVVIRGNYELTDGMAVRKAN